MKLKDFMSTVDCDVYTIYTGTTAGGYHCVGNADFNQECVDYEVKSIHIISRQIYQVDLIMPKKPWVKPSYTIGTLVGVNELSKACFFCANRQIYDKCTSCTTPNESFLNWKNSFIKED